ncbi:ACT domain-containing protein [Anaerocolumna sp. MB42-C2]|uniref:ACT domain-containing protein n=1 Tax=Anaerocolumna sp. MB42-C2 TaxID=3070997 RepID=UPI0027DF0A73|nr:ACT domain-containing protein [Anaerocolumna sp. MB42-C2]WMJ89568.1 amino acid-binding protein [Anaerocolumna sp. MB42-C2]
MLIKQLSVFIENREGRLEKVTETINENNINIISASLADSSEYGMFRMIVSEPEKARTVLKEAGFSANLTDVIAVKLSHKVGMLHQLFKVLAEAGISVEYMYALSSSEIGSMILKVSNSKAALEVLHKSNFDMLTAEEAYHID